MLRELREQRGPDTREPPGAQSQNTRLCGCRVGSDPRDCVEGGDKGFDLGCARRLLRDDGIAIWFYPGKFSHLKYP